MPRDEGQSVAVDALSVQETVRPETLGRLHHATSSHKGLDGGFPKLRGTFVGIPTIRTTTYWVLG